MFKFREKMLKEVNFFPEVGDIVEFNVDSATTVKKIWLFLKLVPR